MGRSQHHDRRYRRVTQFFQTVRRIALRSPIAWVLSGIMIAFIWSIWGTSAIATLPSTPAVVQQPVGTLVRLEQGRARYEAGQFSDAVELWQQVAQDYQRQNDELQQALALNFLSLGYQELGRWQQAEQAIAESLALLQAQESSDQQQPLLAQAMNTQGSLQLAMGNPDAALATWEQAEALYTQIGDEIGRLGCQINQAQALRILGLYRRAHSMLEDVNRTLQAQPDSSLKSIALQNLGNILQILGDLNQAQTLLEQSLSISVNLRHPLEASKASLSLGNLARSAQDYDAALTYYEQSAAIAPTLLPRLEAQTNQLSLLVTLERWSEVQSLWQRLHHDLPALPASRIAIYSQVNIAENLAAWRSRFEHTSTLSNSSTPASSETLRQSHPPTYLQIAQLLAEAVSQAQTLQDSRAEAFVVGQLGEVYEHTQQWTEARQLTQRALTLSQTIRADDITYRWQWQLGRILKQQVDQSDSTLTPNAYDEAIAAYAGAVQTLRSIRQDLLAVSPDVQFSFREKVEPVYRELVNLLLQPAQSNQLHLQQARETIEALQLAELENFFRSACINANPQQIDAIDPSAAVVYPIILADRLEVIISLPNEPLQHYTTDLPQTEVETSLERMLESLNPAFDDRERLRLSQQVYDWLIQPAEESFTSHQIETLVFVPDGAFKNIPMAALHDGHHYLIEKYNIALTPGLQLLAAQSQQQQKLEVLLGGLTEARQGFSALPGVGTELSEISTKVQAEVLLNQDFTEDSLQQGLDQGPFPVIHLATHGQFSSNPQETFILTWDRRVTVQDFYNLIRTRVDTQSRPLELLILSACQTATGDKQAALGLAGLSVRLGARSTIATLWAVNDESTAVLMTEFYQILTQQLGSGKAIALRQAQLQLLQNPLYRHPYYWAPFVLLGNWL